MSGNDQERVVFVENGKAVQVFGSALQSMVQEDGALLLPQAAGWGHALWGNLAVKPGRFRIAARLTLPVIAETKASFLFGGHYHHAESQPEGNLCYRVSLDDYDRSIAHGRTDKSKFSAVTTWDGAPKQIVGYAPDYIVPGRPFDLEWEQRDEETVVRIGGRDCFRCQAVKGMVWGQDGGWPANVGFLADQGAILLHDFWAEGEFVHPLLKYQELWGLGEGGYTVYRIPGLCRSPQGRILAFAEARSPLAGRPTVMRSSEDGGQTWSVQQVIHDVAPCDDLSRSADQVKQGSDPCPLVDHETGAIFLFLLGREGDTTCLAGRAPRSEINVIESRDDGRSWSDPRPLGVIREDMLHLRSGPSQGIQFSSGPLAGRLVMSCRFERIDGFGDERMNSHTCVVYSDDHGRTWQLGGNTQITGSGECTLTDTEHGELLVSTRARGGKALAGRAFAVSRDGGECFADTFIARDLPGTTVQACLLRIGSYLFYSSPAEKRAGLRVWMSTDQGRSWPVSRLIYPGHAAYSAMIDLGDGQIGLLYEQDHYRRLCFVSFTVGSLSAV